MALDPSRVVSRLRELQSLTGDENGEQRVAWMETWAKGRAWLADSLSDLPLDVERDQAGNDWYTLRGESDRAVLIGGHMDSVPNGGWLDGCLNVLAGAEVLRRIADEGTPPVTVRLVDWADEEGARFGVAYLGSSAYTGGFEREWLDLVDADGVTVADAIRGAGGDPEAAVTSPAPELAGYLEVHIEQGPALEREGIPVGVVSAIAGQTRVRIVVRGEAGHAGTVPMAARRDALAAAAEIVLAVEGVGRGIDGLVATVGALELSPNVGNVVPGEARLLLEARHASDAVRAQAAGSIRAEVERIASTRDVAAAWSLRYDTAAVELAPELRRRLACAIESAGHPVRTLVSGAGHDAAMLAGVCPAAMLFVRCAGGISHDPRESVAEADVAVALEVLERFLREPYA